jgi:nitrite reductase (NADH) small subunit
MTVATWTPVCRVEVLTPDRGVAALVDGEQVAIFRLSGHDDEILAIGNVDPFSKAAVLSRGIIGSKGDVVTVASPVYKQRFDLRTGRCLDDESVAVPVHAVRVLDGWIEVAS